LKRSWVQQTQCALVDLNANKMLSFCITEAYACYDVHSGCPAVEKVAGSFCDDSCTGDFICCEDP
jgi:hypothetical protein